MPVNVSASVLKTQTIEKQLDCTSDEDCMKDEFCSCRDSMNMYGNKNK